ncbi:MAG: methyltransferase domain-containing protein, partial [Actinobacteria bacterium]|nr:methyltransferase domain-containing protein [Actinomycetota bacterium]
MTAISEELIRLSGYSEKGFAAGYDAYRPASPGAILDLLSFVAQTDRPGLVVDLGSGTGLSARAWAESAERVVGVEPNHAMREEAERRTDAANVGYRDAYSNATGLPDGCVDIVTCAQSLHWMDPAATFLEAARILRSGGIFAAYDYDVVPVVHWEVELAFQRFLAARRALRAELGIVAGASIWPKEEHRERMEASGVFRYTREVVMHSVTAGDAAALIGLALSIGPIPGDAETTATMLEPAFSDL